MKVHIHTTRFGAGSVFSGGMRRLAAVLLVLAVLVPYCRIVTGRAIPVPDDIFVSDLADGEFPVRVEAGRVLRGGELPVWTSRAMTGMPLIVDPFTALLFAALPPASALGVVWAFFLAVAAAGTYALARRLGSGRAGAFLAGFAFAWSGFFVCQLRHLGVIGTVVWFPWALYCIERASVPLLAIRRRLLWLTAFGTCFGLQLLAGFPQSAYISALFYAALVAFRCGGLVMPSRRSSLKPQWRAAVILGAGALAAVVLGVLIGAAVLLPLKALGAVSDRSGGGSYEWATHFKYYLPNFWTFFVPYINGDISDLSYRGRSIFWEDYGYAGFVTVLAALAAAGTLLWGAFARRKGVFTSRRGRAVVFWTLAGVVAYLLVLGASTPCYRMAFNCLPGLKTFRFPTRFLFVTELALALLAGLGVTALQTVVARREPFTRRRMVAAGVGALLACVTVADLVWYNRRQNPVVERARWLSPPASVAVVRSDPVRGRVYAPGVIDRHKEMFCAAEGWAGDLTPFVNHREFLQPNSNLLYDVPTLTAYAGISPSWVVDLISDHNRHGFLESLCETRDGWFYAPEPYYDWLEALSVRWLFLRQPVLSDRLERVKGMHDFCMYRLKDPLPRVRLVTRVRFVSDLAALRHLCLSGTLNVKHTAVLQHAADLRDVQAVLPETPADDGEARIVSDRATEVTVETRSGTGALLVLADTFYPGWTATVDGAAANILRVNLMQRGVVLPPGRHRIAFSYRSRAVRRGWFVSMAGMALAAIAAIASGWTRRKSVSV